MKKPNHDKQLMRDIVNHYTWTFAKSMASIPHWYIVRKKCDEDEFEWVVRFIRKKGYKKKFFRKVFTYYNLDGYQYWTMGAPVKETTIINRARIE